MPVRSKVLQALAVAATVWLSGVTTAAAQELYVPNHDDGDVSVLNPSTLAEITRITIAQTPLHPTYEFNGEPIFGLPAAVAFTTAHDFAFVTMGSSDKVAVIDTDPISLTFHQVVKYITIDPVSADPLIFLRPAGDRAYITSGFDPFIDVIDVASQEKIAQIRLPGPASATYPLVFSPDGSKGYAGNGIYYTDPFGYYRLALDDDPLTTEVIEMGTVIDFVPTSDSVGDLAMFPDGVHALATGGGSILVLDLVAGTDSPVMCGVDPCAYGFTGGVAFSDGTRAFVVDNGTNELIVLNTQNVDLVQDITPHAAIPTVTESGWELVVANGCTYIAAYNYPSSVFLFNTATDIPAYVTSGATGNWSYSIAGWGLPACLPPGDGDGGRGRVHGAGRLVSGGPVKETTHFEFQAWSTRRGLVGHCNISVDERPGGKGHRTYAIKCVDVTELIISGNTATVRGNARVNGALTTYEIKATDNSKQGKDKDTFSVTTPSLAKSGTLRSGDIKVVPAPPGKSKP